MKLFLAIGLGPFLIGFLLGVGPNAFANHRPIALRACQTDLSGSEAESTALAVAISGFKKRFGLFEDSENPKWLEANISDVQIESLVSLEPGRVLYKVSLRSDLKSVLFTLYIDIRSTDAGSEVMRVLQRDPQDSKSYPILSRLGRATRALDWSGYDISSTSLTRTETHEINFMIQQLWDSSSIANGGFTTETERDLIDLASLRLRAAGVLHRVARDPVSQGQSQGWTIEITGGYSRTTNPSLPMVLGL